MITREQLNQEISIVPEHLLEEVHKLIVRLLKTDSRESEWLEFLDNIDKYAVDTGIEDFSINHEYYLYGGTKRQ